MHQENDRRQMFTRRVVFVGAVKVFCFGLLGARLHELQVVRKDEYGLLAEDNRVNQRLLIPPRGRIFDRTGKAIALNVPTYRLRVVRERSDDLRDTLNEIAGLVELDEETIEEVIGTARQRRAFHPVEVRNDLTWDEISKIAVRAHEMPGVILDSALLRHYPEERFLAHVLGYVGPVNEREQENDDDPLLRLPAFRIGKNGIEKRYDEILRGSAGSMKIEVNSFGREIRELERDDGQPGADIELSLDLDLQKFCHERLSDQPSASAVVLDVHTGAVRALASVPSYDPSEFVNGLSHNMWRELRDNPHTPLINKCIRGQYPPGSTFKMVTAMAALEAGVVTPKYEAFCPGFMKLGRSRFHCWRKGGHGSVNLAQALEQSCDVYFYDVASRVGVDAIADMANRLGLGSALDIDLPGERPGNVPTRQWKLEKIGEKWQRGETLVIGIGQGYMLATPLQLAVMTARLCNGGRAVRPWFARNRAEALEPPPPIGLHQPSVDAVLKGMYDVVNGRRGTARRSALASEDVLMAGKTGTSQVKRITMAERASGIRTVDQIPWNERHHALFVCYAPFDEPRYAVSVVVEHGHSGSKAAAPIARDIMTKVLEIDPAGTPVSSILKKPDNA
jgi:penicillin-binding protein 2